MAKRKSKKSSRGFGSLGTTFTVLAAAGAGAAAAWWWKSQSADQQIAQLKAQLGIEHTSRN